jgi:hypothetical protein
VFHSTVNSSQFTITYYVFYEELEQSSKIPNKEKKGDENANYSDLIKERKQCNRFLKISDSA